MIKLAWTVVAVTITASLAGCNHGAAIKAGTLARANAACSRENAKIAADEQSPTFDFSMASVEAIRHEVSTLTQLGLAAHLHKSFAEIDRATAAMLDVEQGPVTANEHLLAAQSAAARLGVHCSFGARARL